MSSTLITIGTLTAILLSWLETEMGHSRAAIITTTLIIKKHTTAEQNQAVVDIIIGAVPISRSNPRGKIFPSLGSGMNQPQF